MPSLLRDYNSLQRASQMNAEYWTVLLSELVLPP